MTDTNVSLLALMSQNTVAPGASSQTKGSQESGLPDFGSLLSRTGGTKDVMQVAKTERTYTKTSNTPDSGGIADKDVKSVDNGKPTVKEANEAVSAKDKIAKKLSYEAQDEDSETMDVEEVLSKISDQIVQIISQGLEIDTSQLMDTLDQLGLTVGDLLDSSNLANLFSFLNGDTQPLELLMDADFQNLLTQLNTFTEELAQQMGTTVSETAELLAQALGEQQMQQEIPVTASEEQPVETPLQMEDLVEQENDSMKQAVAGQQEQQVEVVSTSFAKEEQPVTDLKQEEAVTKPEEVVALVESDSEEASLMEEKDSDTENFFEKQDKEFFHEEGAGQNVASTHTQSTTVVTPEGTVTEQTVKVVDLQNLVSEITEYVKLTSTSNQISSIEMQLNPANLGKVLVEVATEQGEVTARISTQTEAAKEAMEANVNILRENLEQQGVKVSAVEVTVQSHAFEENLQEDGSKEQEQLAKEMQKQNRRVNVNLNEMTLDDLQGLMSEEDMVIAKMMRDNGNVINIGA